MGDNKDCLVSIVPKLFRKRAKAESNKAVERTINTLKEELIRQRNVIKKLISSKNVFYQSCKSVLWKIPVSALQCDRNICIKSGSFAFLGILWKLVLFNNQSGGFGIIVQLNNQIDVYFSIEVKFSLIHETKSTYAKKRLTPFLFGPCQPTWCGLNDFVDSQLFYSYASSTHENQRSYENSGSSLSDIVVAVRMSMPTSHFITEYSVSQSVQEAVSKTSLPLLDLAVTDSTHNGSYEHAKVIPQAFEDGNSVDLDGVKCHKKVGFNCNQDISKRDHQISSYRHK